MNRYPKIIDPEYLSFEEVYSPEYGEVQIESRSRNKEFFYFLAIFASLSIIVFILFVSSLKGQAGETFNRLLEAIPLLDLKLSKDLVSQLQFPSPITNTIFLGNFVFISFIVFDLIQKENPSNLNYRKTYDEKGQLKLEYASKDLFKESSSVSYIIHLLILILILFSILVTWKPKPKVNVTKIEFIPNQIRSKKAPAKTKRRSQHNSINQGKHNPKKPIKAPEKTPGKPKLPPSRSAPKPKPKAQPKKSISKPSPKPSPKPVLPKPRPKPLAPKPKTLRDAINPVTNSQKNVPLPKLMNYVPDASSSSSSSSNSTPAPKGAKQGSNRGSNIVSRLSNIPRAPDLISSTGQGGSGGSAGNPAPNQFANRAPSLAAQADVNFGPYMSSLQRRIKRAWKPPRGTESNRIVVTFTIQTDGKLVDLRLSQPSGNPEANLAALEAVSKAAPFDRLPKGSAPTVDIEFTFDYNVFQKTRW